MASMQVIMVLMILTATLSWSCNPDADDDKSVLLCFKQRLGSTNLKALASWEDSNVEEWIGVHWNEQSNDVEELHLSGLNLTGKLWPFWCSLSQIHLVDLSNNSFISGPEFLSPITPSCKPGNMLSDLRLDNNQLSGEFPESIFSLSSLQMLNLSHNTFSGEVPDMFHRLIYLRDLDLGSNAFQGHIPSSLGHLSKLQFLSLSQNLLTGQVPSPVFNNCTLLQHLDLSHNMLTGPLSSRLGLLGHLRQLILSSNMFSSQLPESLGNCTTLRELEIESNNLTGTIPAKIFSLRYLSRLSLFNNSLSGRIPQAISNSTSLQTIALGNNYFNGKVPHYLANVSSLRALLLQRNLFHGWLPDMFDAFTRFETFVIALNFISGPIPASLSRHSDSLKLLWLYHNQMEGPIPEWLGNLSGVTIVAIGVNRFQGPVPPELGNMTYVPSKISETIEVFYGNKFIYTKNNVAPTVLAMEGCMLTGNIPWELGKLNLQVLDLSQNRLSGSIPSSLGNSTLLMRLLLSNNDLSGKIPNELTKLHFLTLFNVSHNKLDGEIPTGGQFNAFEASYYEGNDGLCGFPLKNLCPVPGERSRLSQSPVHDEVPFGYLVLVGFAPGFIVALCYSFASAYPAHIIKKVM